jgi:Clp amino terminal domain, pathogenicity island component
VRAGKTGRTDPQLDRPTVRVGASHDDIVFETDAVLRIAGFLGSDIVRARHRRTRRLSTLPVFSSAVRHAVYTAIYEAGRRGVQHAGARHLLTGLLELPDSAARRMLDDRQIRWSGSLEQLVQADPAYYRHDQPSIWRESLSFYGMVADRDWPHVRILRSLARFLLWRLRRSGAGYGCPFLALIDHDAMRKAVRVGHMTVTATDILLSIIDLHEELVSEGVALSDELARWSQAGEILSAYGLNVPTATKAAARSPGVTSDAEDDLQGMSAGGWPPPTTRPGELKRGRTALAALCEAKVNAHRFGHPVVGTTHLLDALLAERHGPVARLLFQLDIDPVAVRSETACRLQ